MNTKSIVLLAVLFCSAASAEVVEEINKETGEITLDNGYVIQLDDVSDIEIGDEVTLEQVTDTTFEEACPNV